MGVNLPPAEAAHCPELLQRGAQIPRNQVKFWAVEKFSIRHHHLIVAWLYKTYVLNRKNFFLGINQSDKTYRPIMTTLSGTGTLSVALYRKHFIYCQLLTEYNLWIHLRIHDITLSTKQYN